MVIPDQPALAKYGSHEVAVEPVNARKLAESELSLPIHPFLDDSAVNAVIEACNTWEPG
jgi:dTDP-4-amino-4,6-dideoxygalactose transaminase